MTNEEGRGGGKKEKEEEEEGRRKGGGRTIAATRLQAQHGLTENLSNYGLLVYLYHMFNSIFQFANILFSYVGSTVYTLENSISMI